MVAGCTVGLFSFNWAEATCSSPSPLSPPLYFIQLFPADVPSDKKQSKWESLLFVSIALLSAAQSQMQGNGMPAGCQRESYSWKALSHSCCCSHGLKEGRECKEYGWGWTGRVLRMSWNKTARFRSLQNFNLIITHHWKAKIENNVSFYILS